MSLADKIVRLSMRADAWLGKVMRFFVTEQPGMVVVLFHNIFRNQAELNQGTANPLEGITFEMFSDFLESWKNAGYHFISLNDLQSTFDSKKRYVMLTFDDGYRSIIDVLPILEKYEAPAILFVSSYNLETGHAYWPDIVYREELVRGKSPKEASNLIETLKVKPSLVIQQFILERYGAEAFFPIDDIARPLTIKELARLASHKLIEIGNHTANHNDLTLCNEEEKRNEISECQNIVAKITGAMPSAISYPFGRFNDEVLNATQAEHLLFGFTCEEGKNLLPLNDNALKIRRYDFLGDSSPAAQCERFRSEVQFFWPVVKKILRFWSHLRS